MKWTLQARRGVLVAAIAMVSAAAPVAADRLSSPSYTIDTSVAAPLGGSASSTSYKMTLGGGESINGMAASSSYKLGQGYVAQLTQSIQLSLAQSTVAFGTVTPGVSKTGLISASVATDAPGYSLSVSQNANLTSGSNTIPAITSGTIATPVSWTEGTTKGLGLTVTGAPAAPVKWGSSGNYKYAAIPNATTTLYTRSGYTGGVSDTVTMQPRIDVSSTQPTGSYSNTVTITATLIP